MYSWLQLIFVRLFLRFLPFLLFLLFLLLVRGVGDLVEAGRAFVTLGDVLCFFVEDFWELAAVFCRFGAEVCLPWAILALSSCCRRVRVGEREHKWGPGRGVATYTWRKNSKRLPGSMEVKYPSPQYEAPVAE
jgi:hypothetical protein